MNKNSSAVVNYISLGILLVYAILSIAFFNERILNVDNSYSFFQIVNTKTFWCPENRWGIVFSQLPLLVAVKLHLPLWLLLLLYSVTFPLLYASVAIACIVLKVYEAALAIALSLIIGISHSFFHPVTETYQAIIYGILAYALLVTKHFSSMYWLTFILLVVISVLSLLSHPIAVFILSFVAVFAFVTKQSTLLTTLGIILPVFGVAVIRFLYAPDSSYDNQQYDNLLESVSRFYDLFFMYPIQFLIKRIGSTYFSLLLVVIALIWLCAMNKRWVLLCLAFGCCGGFILVATLTFSKGDADIMMEKSFMPAISMLLLPFTYLCFNYTSRWQIPILISVVSLLSFIRIIKTSQEYSKRLHLIEKIAQQTLYSKIIIPYNLVDDNAFFLNYWNTGIDSYLLTASKHKAKTLFLMENTEGIIPYLRDSTLFLGPSWMPVFHFPNLNHFYFNMPTDVYHVYAKKP
jgi:hypothetical protein